LLSVGGAHLGYRLIKNRDAAHWIEFAKTVVPGAPFSIDELACMAASSYDRFDDEKYKKALNRNETRIRAGDLTPVEFIDVPGEPVLPMIIGTFRLRQQSASHGPHDDWWAARRDNGGISPHDEPPAKARLMSPAPQATRRVALVTRALMAPFWADDTKDGLGGGAAEILMKGPSFIPGEYLSRPDLIDHPDFCGSWRHVEGNCIIAIESIAHEWPPYFEPYLKYFKIGALPKQLHAGKLREVFAKLYVRVADASPVEEEEAALPSLHNVWGVGSKRQNR
jgi:hypothetical protein